MLPPHLGDTLLRCTAATLFFEPEFIIVAFDRRCTGCLKILCCCDLLDKLWQYETNDLLLWNLKIRSGSLPNMDEASRRLLEQQIRTESKRTNGTWFLARTEVSLLQCCRGGDKPNSARSLSFLSVFIKISQSFNAAVTQNSGYQNSSRA